jgi:3-phytase
MHRGNEATATMIRPKGDPTMVRTAITAVSMLLATLAGAATPPSVAPSVTLQASGMKDQDDMTFWLHPGDPAQSTIITSDKSANRLFVYDLAGRLLQSIAARHPGNIDTRYGFRLAGQPVDIVALNERGTQKVRVYKVDPASRRLQQVDDGRIDTGPNYGFALYKSARTGKLHAFVSREESRLTALLSRPQVKQLELVDDGQGRVTSRGATRQLLPGGLVEGMVADDESGQLFVAEEKVGIWRFDAEPDAAAAGTKVTSVGEHGLTADVEGLTIYRMAAGRGYLIASSQGSNSFNVYDRQPPHRYLGAFALSGVAITDGIDVVSVPLGAHFPGGVFASHNGRAKPFPVQLTRWDEIAAKLNLPGPAPRITSERPADTRAPSAEAALVAAGKVDDDEGRFHVRAACRDDLRDGVTTTVHLNGVPVENGELVKLELDDKTKVKRKNGKALKMKAPAFHLVVSCTDRAGNVATAAAAPAFAR